MGIVGRNTCSEEKINSSGQRPPDTIDEEEDGCRFPANLTRDEYLQFNLLVARTTGTLRHQKLQIGVLIGMIAAGFCILCVSKFVYQYVDGLIVAMLLVLMGLALILFGGMPGYIRRAAARAYDQTVRKGHTYYGTIHVLEDRMTKKSRMSQVTIYYEGKASFIESRDLLVLSEPGNKSIVIPARCLTKEDADVIRRCVREKVDKSRLFTFGDLVPRAAARMNSHTEEPDDKELLVITVQYTPQEFVSMVSDKSLKGFVRTLPVYGSISILTGLLIGMLNGYYWGLITFVCLISIIFLLTVGWTRLRAALSVRRMPPEALTLRIGLSEKGMTIRSPQQPEQLEYIWPMVTSAVERTDSVEFQAGNMFLRIPKRSISDLQTLKALVDRNLGRARS